MTGVAWRPGCPVELADLRRVRLRYWGFDGVVHEGVLVVHRAESSQVVAAFDALFSFRFPIRRMEPIEAFGGDDDRSTRADNTSAFNCRPVRATSHWSQHAFGRAVDINPLENPYVYADGTVLDPASANFIDRPANRGGPGVIDGEGLVVRAFSGVGWGWGGRWKRTKDYQHFSASGG